MIAKYALDVARLTRHHSHLGVCCHQAMQASTLDAQTVTEYYEQARAVGPQPKDKRGESMTTTSRPIVPINADIRCYRCNAAAAGQCPQCRRPFCADHGSKFCLDCRRAGGSIEVRLPLLALPSSWMFRGAVAAIVIAFGLVAWDSVRWVSAGGPTLARNTIAQQAPPAPTEAVAKPTATPTPEERTHTVADGESLSTIAAQYEITTGALAAANNIANTDLVRVGQILKVPPKQ